jgi:hypothetical protein
MHNRNDNFIHFPSTYLYLMIKSLNSLMNKKKLIINRIFNIANYYKILEIKEKKKLSMLRTIKLM